MTNALGITDKIKDGRLITLDISEDADAEYPVRLMFDTTILLELGVAAALSARDLFDRLRPCQHCELALALRRQVDGLWLCERCVTPDGFDAYDHNRGN